MAFKSDGAASYEVKKDGIRSIIEEKNNMATIMQEVAWNGRQAHLEIRKWIINEKGETPYRGVTFITEEGPHTLATELVKNGFGSTPDIINILKDRDDFETSLVNAIGKKKVVESKNKEVEITEDDYFDPASMFKEE